MKDSHGKSKTYVESIKETIALLNMCKNFGIFSKVSQPGLIALLTKRLSLILPYATIISIMAILYFRHWWNHEKGRWVIRLPRLLRGHCRCVRRLLSSVTEKLQRLSGKARGLERKRKRHFTVCHGKWLSFSNVEFHSLWVSILRLIKLCGRFMTSSLETKALAWNRTFCIDWCLLLIVRTHKRVPTETEVLITSVEKDLLKERIGKSLHTTILRNFLGIATRLWERGIKAEYIYERSEDGVEEDALIFCQEKRIPVVVVMTSRSDLAPSSLSIFSFLNCQAIREGHVIQSEDCVWSWRPIDEWGWAD